MISIIQYLTTDINLRITGCGSPSKWVQQDKNFWIVQVAESVYEHRLMKHQSSVLVKDKVEAKKIKISNFIISVVDDMVRESMEKGD